MSLGRGVELVPAGNPILHACGQLVKVGVKTAKLAPDLVRQLQVALLNSLRAFAQLDLLEEGNDVLLPEDALVLLPQVHKGVGGLAVPDVGQASLHAKVEVIANDLSSHLPDQKRCHMMAWQVCCHRHAQQCN